MKASQYIHLADMLDGSRGRLTETQRHNYELVVAAARKYGVPPSLLAAQLWQENKLRPSGNSSAGARGLGQFIPSTARRYGVDVNDPVSSADGAARYMRDLLRMFNNDPALALAGYNAGEGAVMAFRDGRTIRAGGKLINPNRIRTGGIPPYAETQDYVRVILPGARKLDDLWARTGQPADIPLPHARVHVGEPRRAGGVLARSHHDDRRRQSSDIVAHAPPRVPVAGGQGQTTAFKRPPEQGAVRQAAPVPTAVGRPAVAVEKNDLDGMGALVVLFTIASNYYKGTDPELAASFSGLVAMFGGLGRASGENARSDRELALALLS